MAARTARLIAVLLCCLAAAVALGLRLPAATGSLQVAPAQRIVSVVPSATEIIVALGAGSQLAGVSSYDELPAGTPDLPRVGALLDPDTERILSLRPDLVILYGSQVELRTRLERAGLRTYSYRHAGLRDVLGAIDELAALTGRRPQGAELTAAIGARLDEVGRRVQGRPQPRTLLVIGREPGSLRGMYVSGGVGFLHDMLVLAGGTNVFDDVARESAQPSMEVLLVRAPEVIVELKASSTSTDGDLGVWQRLSTIPAVRNNRLAVLTGQHLVVPGSRIADATEALARVLHPDAFH